MKYTKCIATVPKITSYRASTITNTIKVNSLKNKENSVRTLSEPHVLYDNYFTFFINS
jgi:hypothetical protein